MQQYSLFIGAGLALILAILIGLMTKSRVRSGHTFFFGDKPLSNRQISLSLFSSWMSVGNVIVAGLVLTISYGWLMLWAVITWGLGFIVLSRHAAPIVRAASAHATIHSFLRHCTGSTLVSKTTSLLTLITACGVIALELMVGSAIFGAALNSDGVILNIIISTVMIAVVAVFYTRAGGFKTVITTDRFQSYALFVGLVSLLGLAYLGQSPASEQIFGELVASQYSAEPAQDQLLALIGFIVGFGALQLFILLGDMTTWQRIQLGADEPTVVKASRQAALQNVAGWSLLFATGYFLINWDASTLTIPLASGELRQVVASQAQPLTSMLTNAYQSHIVIVLGLVFLSSFGLVSAVLSTCDSFLLVAAQAVIFEWRTEGGYLEKKEDILSSNADLAIYKLGRTILPIVMLASIGLFMLVTMYSIPLVAVIFLLLSAQTAIAPIAVAALYHPKELHGLGSVIFLALLFVIGSIIALFALSGLADSLSLAYAYSYLAPIVAIVIPVFTLLLAALFSKSRRGLLSLPIELLLSSKKQSSNDS